MIDIISHMNTLLVAGLNGHLSLLNKIGILLSGLRLITRILIKMLLYWETEFWLAGLEKPKEVFYISLLIHLLIYKGN